MTKVVGHMTAVWRYGAKAGVYTTVEQTLKFKFCLGMKILTHCCWPDVSVLLIRWHRSPWCHW